MCVRACVCLVRFGTLKITKKHIIDTKFNTAKTKYLLWVRDYTNCAKAWDSNYIQNRLKH